MKIYLTLDIKNKGKFILKLSDLRYDWYKPIGFIQRSNIIDETKYIGITLRLTIKKDQIKILDYLRHYIPFSVFEAIFPHHDMQIQPEIKAKIEFLDMSKEFRISGYAVFKDEITLYTQDAPMFEEGIISKLFKGFIALFRI